MSVLRRRGLLVDDPLAAGEERSPAAPGMAGSEVAGRLWHIPIGETIRQMNLIGVSSIPIAIIVVGSSAAVLAFYTAQQFVQFGQANLIGSVTALAVAREVAPVLTAVLVAARIGAAIAAELGTMTVTEQVDALRALAVSPIHYLVVPRFLGATLIMIGFLLFLTIRAIVNGTDTGLAVASGVVLCANEVVRSGGLL